MTIDKEMERKLKECVVQINSYLCMTFAPEVHKPLCTTFGEGERYAIEVGTVAAGADTRYIAVNLLLGKGDCHRSVPLIMTLDSECLSSAYAEPLLALVCEWADIKARLHKQAEHGGRWLEKLNAFQI